MQVQPGETLREFIDDLKKAEKWVVPSPPPQDDCTCEVREVRLSRLPPDASVNEMDSHKRSEYRATVVFQLDRNPTPIMYVLYTNPVFVTLPPCPAQDGRQNAGLHEFHKRELLLFGDKILSIGELKGYTPDNGDGGRVAIINATGNGAEILARAWCSETGRNAVIRRLTGPCFVCAVHAAYSLHIRVLIWVG